MCKKKFVDCKRNAKKRKSMQRSTQICLNGKEIVGLSGQLHRRCRGVPQLEMIGLTLWTLSKSEVLTRLDSATTALWSTHMACGKRGINKRTISLTSHQRIGYFTAPWHQGGRMRTGALLPIIEAAGQRLERVLSATLREAPTMIKTKNPTHGTVVSLQGSS